MDNSFIDLSKLSSYSLVAKTSLYTAKNYTNPKGAINVGSLSAKLGYF